MDRESIEAKDQRLLKSFRDIVAQKQQAKEERPSSRLMRFLIVMALATVIAFPAWLLIIRKLEAPKAITGEVAREDGPSNSDPVLVIDEGGGGDAAAYEVTIEPEKKTAENQVETAKEPAIESAEPAPYSPAQVRIADIVICRGVENREAVSPTQVFSLGERVKPTVWMTVMAEKPTFTLNHAYYLNDNLYCTVPLNIRYTRTRTWSRVTLNKDKHVGAWRVDVVDEDGRVLAQTSFEVRP